MYDFLINFANVLMVVTSLFLICLVLIQRGKGGGLAGAFGGAGGSSAFGTKAGDVFTRVTIIVAGFWFLLALLLVYSNNRGGAKSKFADDDSSTSTASGEPTPGGRGTAPVVDVKKKVPAIPTPPETSKEPTLVPPATTPDKAIAPTVPDTTKKPATETAPVVPPANPKP